MRLKYKVWFWKIQFRLFKVNFFERINIPNEILKHFKSIGFQSVIIGANDVSSFDDIETVLEKSINVVLVEPHPKYFHLIEDKYLNNQRYRLVNRAIHLSEQNMSLYSVSNIGKYDSWVQGISSFDINHLIKNKIEPRDIETINVKCISVEDLLTEFTFPEIPLYIQIDVEGYDFEVFKGINFEKFNVKFLKMEVVNLQNYEVHQIREKLSINSFVSFEFNGDLYALK